MTREEMCEVLEQVRVPGMSADAEWWVDEDGSMSLAESAFMCIIEEYHRRGLFSNDDALASTIRFGAAWFIGDAMRNWEDCLDGIPVEAQVLWDLCNEHDDVAAIPWKYFRDAFPWLLYHATEPFWWGCVNDDRYYDVDVNTIMDDVSVTVQIGAGWSDMWCVNHNFDVSDNPDRVEFLRRLNEGLPYYMRVLE